MLAQSILAPSAVKILNTLSISFILLYQVSISKNPLIWTYFYCTIKHLGLDLDRPLPIPFFLLSPLEQNWVPLVCEKNGTSFTQNDFCQVRLRLSMIEICQESLDIFKFSSLQCVCVISLLQVSFLKDGCNYSFE